MDDGERLAERLSLFLLAQLGDDAAVRLESVPRRAGGGSSKEHWAFDASWRVGGTRRVVPLLLRRDPSAGVVDTATEVEF
ncbi:MAG TPA: phosphotransferase family protein, partial [Mycobacteriales bacterium]|nr:phosphotransferase family protein [Mycobacteriales bacterium]